MTRISTQLAELRRRERILGMAWGGACLLALIASALAIACLIDWGVDRIMETPRVLRVGLLVAQLVVGSLAAIWFVGVPLLRRWSDTHLALYVEEKLGTFGHRLISAVQLNRPSARTAGMSPSLIAAVTRQAEEQAAGLRFEQLADHRRVKKALALVLTLALMVTLAAVLLPSGLLEVLLARQLLHDRAIPRSVHIVGLNPDKLIWPGGEEVVLRFQVFGKFRPDDRGYLSVTALDGSRTDYYELRARPGSLTPPDERAQVSTSAWSGGDAAHAGELVANQKGALYETRVPPGSVDFKYYAYLRDGRTHAPAEVHYVSRPEIVAQAATVLLPDHYGKRPDGSSYSRIFAQGEVTEAVASARIRVVAEVNKPIERAVLELISSPTAPLDEAPLARPLEMTITSAQLSRPSPTFPSPQGGGAEGEGMAKQVEVCQVTGTFDLAHRPGAYRIRLWDKHGLTNKHVKPRLIHIVPEAPPTVALLPEQWTDDNGSSGLSLSLRELEALDVSGHPVPLKKPIRIAYRCQGPYGLGQARLRYRLLRGGDGENNQQSSPGKGELLPVASAGWSIYPLALASPSEAVGRFDPATGAFENSSSRHQVYFYKASSPQPEYLPDGLEGGGRFDLQTAALRHPDGQEVREGDRIQFFVEVSNRSPNAALDPNAWGRSEIRTKTFGSDRQFIEYVRRVLDEQQKLSQLERQQRDMWWIDLAQRKPFDESPGDAGGGIQPVKEAGIRLLTRNISRAPLVPSTNHSFILENTVNDALPLSKVTLRYWFTLNAGKQQVPEVQVANAIEVGGRIRSLSGLVLAKVGKPMQAGGDSRSARYLEISFRDGAGTLPPGARVVVGCTRKHSDGSPINQSNDYSYDHGLPAIGFDSAKVTAYFDGKLIWGMEPAGKGLAEELKFGRSWLLVGPFPNPPAATGGDKLIGRDIPYPPEKEPFAADKEFDGLKGKVRWQPKTFVLDRIDLDGAFSHREAGVAYALCWFRCEQPRAILATGSDDGIKVWLNRKLVLDKAAHRDAIPGDDKTPVELAPGWNELLVKVDNKTDEWAFYLDLLDPKTSKPIPNVACRTAPPVQEPRSYAREWLVLGAFPHVDDSGLDKGFPPESGKVQVKEVYEGQGGKIQWKRYVSTTDEVQLDKIITLPLQQPAIAYAACWVRSERQQSAVISVGSGGGIKVWLDGENVLRAAGPVTLFNAPVTLKAGWNEVLVKLERKTGKWGFTFELRDPQSGQSLEGIEYRTTPPNLDGKFIRSWQVLGPFPNVNHLVGFQFAYPPEKTAVDLKKSYAGTTGEVRWQPIVHNADRLDLRKYMPGVPPTQPGAAYLACWLRSDKEQMVQLATGSDGTLKVWLNRQMVLSRGTHGNGTPGTDQQAVKLSAGWNEVLVKVGTHPSGRWGLYFELRRPDGAPPDGLEFCNTPPASGERKPAKPGAKR